MLSIHKTIDNALHEIKDFRDIREYGDSVWINLINPSEGELRQVWEAVDAPADFFTDPLDADERARMDYDEGHLLLIVRLPVVNQDDENIPFTTLPLGVILSGSRIITICKSPNEIVGKFAEAKVKGFKTNAPGRFVIQLFHEIALTYLRYLKEINRRTSEIEVGLHRSLRNEGLVKLINIEKSLVYFMTSLKANDILMERIQRSSPLKLTEDEFDLLDDALTESKQAIGMTKIYTDILSGMMGHFGSIISNNLNSVMKLLTTITIILMIPNIITGFYGMNIELPWQSDPHAVQYITSIISGLSLASVLGVLYFSRKNWF